MPLPLHEQGVMIGRSDSQRATDDDCADDDCRAPANSEATGPEIEGSAMIVPVFVVGLGRRTALKACSWAESSVRDGKKTLQAAVKEVELPEGIQGAEPKEAG